MEQILKEILKELQYQTKLMETLYERKDEQKFDMSSQMNNIKKLMLSNPMIQNDPQAAAFINNMMKEVGK